ncbi:MAG: hypothetical protein ABSG04_10950 [Verrucomicrobiota bacterium]
MLKAVPRPGWAAALMRLLAFFGLALVLAFALDFSIKHGMRSVTTSELGALNQEMSGRVNSEIIISGSSRALCSYDPQVIHDVTGKTVFNIGQNGTRTDFQLAFLKTYLKHNVKPRILVQNLDPHTFALSREIAFPGTYAAYLDEEEIYAAFRKMDPGVWKWKYLPLYRFAVEDDRFTWAVGAARLFGLNPREDLFRGYAPRSTTMSGEFDAWKQQHPEGEKIDFDPGGVEVVTELMTLCQKEGIKPVLVFAPIYDEFNPLIRNRNQIFDQFVKTAGRFHAPFWDYSQSPLTHRKELFANTYHMNQFGAELFSRDLSQRLAALIATMNWSSATNSDVAKGVNPAPQPQTQN